MENSCPSLMLFTFSISFPLSCWFPFCFLYFPLFWGLLGQPTLLLDLHFCVFCACTGSILGIEGSHPTKIKTGCFCTKPVVVAPLLFIMVCCRQEWSCSTDYCSQEWSYSTDYWPDLGYCKEITHPLKCPVHAFKKLGCGPYKPMSQSISF